MRVASLRTRFLAAFVDAVVAIGSLALMVVLGFAGAAAYARLRGDGDEPGDDESDDAEDGLEEGEEDESSGIPAMIQTFRPPPQAPAALLGASAGLAVAGRNWRGPGFRVVGLRRVDARTGELVRVRSALIGASFDQAWQAATRQVFASRSQCRRDRINALGPQLRALERRYASDPQERQRAVMEFYEANDVTPFAGCGWQLGGQVIAQLVLALGTRGGRTVRDRISGTSVVADG